MNETPKQVIVISAIENGGIDRFPGHSARVLAVVDDRSKVDAVVNAEMLRHRDAVSAYYKKEIEQTNVELREVIDEITHASSEEERDMLRFHYDALEDMIEAYKGRCVPQIDILRNEEGDPTGYILSDTNLRWSCEIRIETLAVL